MWKALQQTSGRVNTPIVENGRYVLILLVSYDAKSLKRRMQDLENAGHAVVPGPLGLAGPEDKLFNRM
ncbi:MAG TPA: hypothetical protein VNB49_17915 [Candidatus Dormibacteraeota bacterium]|nr:hypothetical protein [Candidatus Dormibacteraeota bacterium]